MISYLEGKLLSVEKNIIIVLVAGIGYEVVIPSYLLKNFSQVNENITLFIYYHQTERQPKPILIGFNKQEEKKFFEKFISVDAIGPTKAVKALEIPISNIAKAIETENLKILEKLQGIGKRTAQKIVAALKGKLTEFILIDEAEAPKEIIVEENLKEDGLSAKVLNVLVEQLGYKHLEAISMIKSARSKNPNVQSPEELFDEIFKANE